MRIVAKASIVVYRDPATNQFFMDPLLPEHPLFKLGNFQGVKGDKGDAGADGATGAQGEKGDAGADGAAGAQGEKGDAGTDGKNGTNGADGTNASPAIKLTGSTLNTARTGVVSGLEIQSVASPVALIGSVVVFRGLLKLVSTATGNVSLQVNIGGLTFTFGAISVIVGTQFFNYETTVHVIGATEGFAVERRSFAGAGATANIVQSTSSGKSGAVASNTVSIQFKSPVTVQVTTLLALTQIL